jgi:hypothetical protein
MRAAERLSTVEETRVRIQEAVAAHVSIGHIVTTVLAPRLRPR